MGGTIVEYQKRGAMSTVNNKEAIRRLVQEGWSEHNLGAFDDFFWEKAVWHGLPPEWGEGIEQIKRAASFWFEVLPDFVFTVEDLTAEEDRVAFRWNAEGTHEAELFGVAPTGKRVTFSGVAIQRFKDGKCVDYREVWDRAGLMEQLGAGPN
ncbi:MAG: ester cyclase [Dehalococcoidia bacterium]